MEPIFACEGCADFRCAKDVKVWAFNPLNEEQWMSWVLRHRARAPGAAASPCCDAPNLYMVQSGAHAGKFRCLNCKHVLRRGLIPFFGGSHLKVSQLLAILWCMCTGQKQQFIMDQCELTRKTVSQHQIYFCELAVKANSVLLKAVIPLAVKGQIDETKIGARKYNRGHRARIGSSIWLWAIVLIEAEGNTLYANYEYVPRRDQKTLIEMIKKTTSEAMKEISSDCWGGTIKAMKEAFPHITHRKVNHSKEFVAADGTHTNTVESHNNCIKQILKSRWYHMPEDVVMLDLKVSFAQLVMNCRPSRLNLDVFAIMLQELFAWKDAVHERVEDPDRQDGYETEDGFAMGQEPKDPRPREEHTVDDDTEVESEQVPVAQGAVEVPGLAKKRATEPQQGAKEPRRSNRLAEMRLNQK